MGNGRKVTKARDVAQTNALFVELPFVGRTEELSALENSLRRAIKGDGGLVFISGEPGIGKTRLAHKFAERAVRIGFRYLEARCRGDQGSPPYCAWIELLRQFSQKANAQLFFRACGENTDQIVRLVPELFESTHSPASGSQARPEAQKRTEDIQKEELQFLNALTQIFFRLSKESPLLLFLDDWQWCDTASLKLLQYMRSSGLMQNAILILCSFRDSDLLAQPSIPKSSLSEFLSSLEGERSLDLIHLKRFGQDTVADFLRKLFSKEEIPQDFVRVLYSRTGGNPFFLSEALKTLVEEKKILRNSAGGWELIEISEIAIPQTISKVVRQRLDRLGEETMKTLSAASVIGETFDLEILSKVLREPNTQRLRVQIESSRRSGLILEVSESRPDNDLTYSFSDESVRDLLYENILQEQRTEYHERVGLALEESFRASDSVEQHASELGYHFFVCGNKEKSVEYYGLAGRRASSLYAHQTACRNFHFALEILSQLGRDTDSVESKRRVSLTRAELLDALGLEAQFVSSELVNLARYWEESSSIYQEIGEKRKAANILSRLGIMYYLMMFDFEKSDQFYSKALSLLQGDDSAELELARVYVWKVFQDVWDGDREMVISISRKALELAEKIQAYDVIAMARTQILGISRLSEFEHAMASHDDGIQLAIQNNHISEAAFCYFHRAAIHVNTKGASQRAIDLFHEAIDYSKKTGQFIQTVFNKTELAYEAYLPLGEWQKAEELAENVRISVQNFPPSSLFAILADSVRGQVFLSRGELGKAEECLRNAELKTKGHGILQIDVPLYMSLARLYIYKGEYGKSSNYLNEAYRRSKKRGLVIINCVPHVQLLSLMIEFSVLTESETRGWHPGGEELFLEETLAELTECAHEINLEWPLAYLHRAEGLIAAREKRLDEAANLLEKSADVFAKLGWPYELARTQYQLAIVHLRGGKILQAAKFLDSASLTFAKLGANQDLSHIASIRNSFEEQGLPIFNEYPKFENKDADLFYESLLGEFVQDYVFKRLEIEKCGWRSLSEMGRNLKLPKYALYGKKAGASGPIAKELISRRLVETRTFLGARGRGGEIMKVRIAFKKKRQTGVA
ncbi:MAG TPA: AAA family ATPase [Nitrososphaerales archaeon]|nr:AAA family ATPase [Nitrososphaerales archaeon]